MEALFIDPKNLDGGVVALQLLFLLAAYSFILMKGSKLIAEGSEMLMLVLNPGIVGGLLLPVLGAVPDGAIVLFSCLGPDAATQVSVGVGTLAGSTIMVLTIPYALCIFLGRVDVGKNKETGQEEALYKRKPKLTVKGFSNTLTKTGAEPGADVPLNAKIMIATAAVYLIVQAPAWDSSASPSLKNKAILAAFVISMLCFIGYAVWQVYSASSQELQRKRATALRKHALLESFLSFHDLLKIEESLAQHANVSALEGEGQSSAAAALATAPASMGALRKLFNHYDTDGSGSIDKKELRIMMKELGLGVVNKEDLDELAHLLGGPDGEMNFEEFTEAVVAFSSDKHKNAMSTGAKKASFSSSSSGDVRQRTVATDDKASGSAAAPLLTTATAEEEEDDDDDEEDDEEEENEHAHLTPGQIKLRAFGTLLLGVVLVTLFSDPMCDVLSNIGDRTGIPAFYIAFVLTPLVSNASEIISGVVLARRQSASSITVTFSQLLGAATMNNTFCLGIFLILVYVQDIPWNFTAEIVPIIAVQVIVAVLAQARVQKPWHGLVYAALYPASLGLVMALKAAGQN